MQKINLIAQGVLKLSHRENLHDNEDDEDDTHPGRIIVRDGMYSVADKKEKSILLDRGFCSYYTLYIRVGRKARQTVFRP